MMFFLPLPKVASMEHSKSHQAWNLPLATKQNVSPLTFNHWIHFKGHQVWNLPLATKQNVSPLTYYNHWIHFKGHQAWNLPLPTKLWSSSPLFFLFSLEAQIWIICLSFRT
jgi:hypothetical protein